MFLSSRNPARSSPRPPWSRARAVSWSGRRLLPWVFVVGIAVGSALPLRHWARTVLHVDVPAATDSAETEAIWRRAGQTGARYPVDVLRIIDGDTFEARVHLWPDLDMVTRVRLRGIDAPERNGACEREIRLAGAATDALRRLLGEGNAMIFNIGPDKYAGRVVADAAARGTDNVSAALLAAGHARAYGGGHRGGWC